MVIGKQLGGAVAAAVFLLVVLAVSGCAKWDATPALTHLQLKITYEQLEGAEAVDGKLVLLNLNTRDSYERSVVGFAPVHLELGRGLYRVHFSGFARCAKGMARVVAVDEEAELLEAEEVMELPVSVGLIQ